MKTSNKLLLSFVGLIVLLMLLSDTVMWANYKRGRSGDGLLTDDDKNGKERKTPVSAFKVLKIEGISSDRLTVERDEKYQIYFWGEKDRKFDYSVQNDTMFIKMKDGDDFVLECPALQTVILSEGNGVSLRNFNLPSLNILAGKSCNVQLIDMKVNVLDVKGGEENEFEAAGKNSQVDSIYLQLGKSSVLRSYAVPYGHVSMAVDSLRELELTGESLTSMKQIK
ncbi:hypothetical protein [Chitinophaga filiformis]|uniref:Uncharacterized protein n=1 Tax=Chitinophaga filiformis TaxID=104663 RepID=A0A1G7HG27_CHIFI|nr:hypothetical protein [Chitinophaga filiformis]SDE99432.1 hypothetical protein SAMN04488121_101457 [Chitinophaga filiformis]